MEVLKKIVIRKITNKPGAGDCIAFFAGTEQEFGNGSVMSYMHVGQHSAASKEFAIDSTVASTSFIDSHGSLIDELKKIGYKNLTIETGLCSLGYKPKCLYCDRENEPVHYLCESCGDGMCEECYQEEKEHDSHFQNPAENAETEENILALEDAFENGYGCESCVNKVLKMVKNEKDER